MMMIFVMLDFRMLKFTVAAVFYALYSVAAKVCRFFLAQINQYI